MKMKIKMNYNRRQTLAGYAFISPWLFGSIFLLAFPILFSLVLSFVHLTNRDFTDIAGMSFAGLEHYKRAFVVDTKFLPIFLKTASDSAINTVMILIVSLIIAIMISRNIKFRGFFRSIFFLPVLLGASFVMEQILGQNVDQQATEVARGILLPPEVQEYIGPEITKYIIEFFNRITNVMWKSGVQIIIALAGIQGIATSLYESAKVDGATEWEMFWKITLPMMSPILLLNTVYTIVASMTESGGMISYIVGLILPNQSSQTGLQYEYSAALGWIYFIFILLFIGLAFIVMRPFINRVNNTTT